MTRMTRTTRTKQQINMPGRQMRMTKMTMIRRILELERKKHHQESNSIRNGIPLMSFQWALSIAETSHTEGAPEKKKKKWVHSFNKKKDKDNDELGFDKRGRVQTQYSFNNSSQILLFGLDKSQSMASL